LNYNNDVIPVVQKVLQTIPTVTDRWTFAVILSRYVGYTRRAVRKRFETRELARRYGNTFVWNEADVLTVGRSLVEQCRESRWTGSLLHLLSSL